MTDGDHPALELHLSRRKVISIAVATVLVSVSAFAYIDNQIDDMRATLIYQAEKTRELEVVQAEATRDLVTREAKDIRKGFSLQAVSFRTAINNQGASVRNQVASSMQEILREMGYIAGALDVRGSQHE